MKKILALLFVLAFGHAQAQPADSQVQVLDNTYGVLPAGQLKVTPTGGVQQKLSDALASSGGCTTNCTVQTMNATGSAGYLINGLNALSISNQTSNTSLSVGPAAGASLPVGSTFQTFVGWQAGNAYSASGGEDTCVGSSACPLLVSGIFDTAVGQHAMGFELTANASTAIGNDDQRNYVSAGGNTSIGKSALETGGGVNNTAVGFSALVGNSGNIIVGGTATNGDTISLTFTGGYTGSPITTAPITITGGETTTQIATALLAAINANSTLSSVMFGSGSSGNTITLFFPGTQTTGYAITTTSTITGSATETITVTGGATGANNIAIGQQAMSGQYGLTTGGFNIAIGQQTSNALTTANFTVAIGQSALNNLTSGTGAIGIGTNAGASLTTNSGTYVGTDAGQYVSGSANEVFGANALQGNSGGSTAQLNTVFGQQVLQAATSANEDAVFGHASVLLCTTCNNISAFGYAVGTHVTTAQKSTLIGSNVANATFATGFGVILIGSGQQSLDTPAGNTSDYINIENAVLINTQAPTISSGFGTSPSVTHGTSTYAFTVNVGTGGAASTGVIAMPAPAAPNGWACSVSDTTTPTGNSTWLTASTATTITLTNYSRTTGAAAAWPASDVITVGPCTAY